jgi:hypothetical protein
MRAQTESGTWETVALAPVPTAAGAAGNLTVGPGPDAGTTESRVVVAFAGGAFDAGGLGVVVVVVVVPPELVTELGGFVVAADGPPVEPEQQHRSGNEHGDEGNSRWEAGVGEALRPPTPASHGAASGT